MLITVEGIDGSGKSTVCEALASTYPEAVMTREPTGSWYGDAVRRSVSTPDANPLAELFLYTADHAHHLASTIEPALAADTVIISDRYSDSRYAYQGVTLSSHFDDSVAFVQSVHEPWTRPPDLTIYLDVPAAVGAERSGETNKFERTAYLEEVRQNYERLIDAEPDRFHRIDGTASESTVQANAIAAVESELS